MRTTLFIVSLIIILLQPFIENEIYSIALGILELVCSNFFNSKKNGVSEQ